MGGYVYLPQTHLEDLLHGDSRSLSLWPSWPLTGSLDIYRFLFKTVGLDPVSIRFSSGVNKLAKCYKCVNGQGLIKIIGSGFINNYRRGVEHQITKVIVVVNAAA